MNLESIWYGPPPDHPPTLVFLHEGLGSATMWRDFPRRVSEATGLGALVYSRGGYGASDPVPLPLPIHFMHDEAAKLDDILEQHKIRESILIGHSDGGSIALIYAGSRPRTPLRALILEAPHVFAEPSGLASIARMKVQYETSDLRQRLARYHKDVDNAFRGWNDVWLHPDFRNWNVEEYLPSIDVPMLLIQGTEDEYGTWKQIEAIERQVRGPVTTLRLTGCGHSPHRDQTEVVLSAMANFVKSGFGIRDSGFGR